MKQYEEFISLRTYSRYIDSLGRRETWHESVQRLINWWCEKYPNHEKWFREVALPAIENKEVMPSMRSLQTAGKALDRDHCAGYNCSYTPIDDPRCFDEIMYILLCGTGVGFSVERQYVSKLPEIPEEFHEVDTEITVPDSKVGWANSFRQLISLLYSGAIPRWNMDKVRPAGERLKTFGGRSSGPQPLRDLFNFTVEMFKNAAGRQLSSLECHDLVCKVGDVVVVGGVRRSALISLSNLSDDRMRMAKSGQWWIDNPQRALANNSACYTEKPEFEVFLKEWESLYESKSGERGIFSRKASKKQAERSGRRDTAYEYGTNPCVTGSTPVLTNKGYFPIEELVDSWVSVWNGKGWVDVIPFSTGKNPTLKVTLSDGAVLECTDYHQFILAGGVRVSADELKEGERLEKFSMPVVEVGVEYPIHPYSQGFYSGDGNTGLTHSWLYDEKYEVEPRLIGEISEENKSYFRKTWKHGPMFDKSWVPVDGTLKYCLEWFAGLIDADGTVTRDKNGNGIQIVSIDHNFLDRVRLMLTRMGCRPKVVDCTEAGMRSMPDGRGGYKDYKCKETKRLLIGNMDTYQLMNLGLKTSRLKIHSRQPQRDARRFVTVKSVEHGHIKETYCFNEPSANRGTFNGIVTGQCSEIILRPRGFCNLTEVVVRPDDDYAGLRRKVEIASILGTFQSSLTDFRYLRSGWKKNAEEERLLGVSLTGIMDNPLLYEYTKGEGEKKLDEILNSLRDEAIKVNKEWAKRIGINSSVSITCVKPSGTVSQLCNTASGIHPRFSDYYLRSVRADRKDPLAHFMIDKGFPWEEDVHNKDNYVFYFPIKSPEGSVTADSMGAMDQLALWEVYQDHWCEHKPSMTCYYDDREFLEIGNWVWNHFDKISGISFLPRMEHIYQQAPYQKLTEEEYNEWLEKMPEDVDWTDLEVYEGDDFTEGSQELACSGATSCEI